MRLSRFLSSKPIYRSGLLTDSYNTIWDISKSKGSWLVTKDGDEYLDFNSGFGSQALAWNHPVLTQRMKEEDFSYYTNKPSNSDFYTEAQFRFLDTFKTQVVPVGYDYVFYVDGGAPAVENALKVAMDWKRNKYPHLSSTTIMYLEKAFHGRLGYTLSLTNTDPNKTKGFSKFDWVKIKNPAYIRDHNNDHDIKQDILERESLSDIENQIEERLDVFGRNDIAAMIIEPIQCEGGDRHFGKEYLQGLQKLCHKYDILFILDEVQTGFYTTGKTWCFQHYDLKPDIVVFGKKSQQCGIFAKKSKIDEARHHCFNTSGRINSTWGGNLVDMIRSNHIMDIVVGENLDKNAEDMGKYWLTEMNSLNLNTIKNIRSKGLIMSFDCDNDDSRDRLLKQLFGEKVIALGCGDKTIRFRPNLSVSEEDIEACVARTLQAIKSYNRN